ncbi:MAG: MMPL family transporter [Oleiphilaceae bacterium]|nr:MMPL family transporter [Oleiphilaceae bacterium]
MSSPLFRLYRRTVLTYPLVTLIGVLIIAVVAGLRISDFRLDASTDSLVLEGDESLAFYREMSERFESSDDFLVITYNPYETLFSEDAIRHLRSLRDAVAGVEGIADTTSMLDVPLLHHPDISLTTVSRYMMTLDEDDVPLDEAREALLNNPIYPKMLISEDGETTAIQATFPATEELNETRERRDALRELDRREGLDSEQQQELEEVSQRYIRLSEELGAERDRVIAEVRAIMDAHSDKATLFLGGVPMIVADMIAFVESDLVTFGLGVLVFMLLTLILIFRQPRWVMLPLVCCALTVWLMLGYLGWTQWPVTVISSNFVSLLLIITLSLTIHLIVRYREFQQADPEASRLDLISNTVETMSRPCFYMALTTVVAFGSLFFSDIRPVIDFGLMMTIGIAIAFCVVFLLLPASLVLLPPAALPPSSRERPPLTRHFAVFTDRHGNKVLSGSVILAVLCIAGMGQLSVENRFIDYFKSSTEIYQGMMVIDEKLGGTMPMDVIVTAPGALMKQKNPDQDPFLDAAENCMEEDPFLEDECRQEQREKTFTSWFSAGPMSQLESIQDYLDGLDTSGKVLSPVPTVRLAERINGGALSALQLGLLPRAMPQDLREILILPYFSNEHSQVRFNVRLIESSPDLNRDRLMSNIRDHLTGELGLMEEQVDITGMVVLYNNMLQSLFSSQIKTMGVVFLAIMAMFLVLFRSVTMALIAIFPNMLAAGTVLGMMGWLSIPLDMMTITVAAISVGIAVDNTIHYVHRFRMEFLKDGDYQATMHRCHGTIGRAMFYTSLTIIVGFSILSLSNFIPTIYFGLFTGLAMLMALLGALTLLPKLIVAIKPLGRPAQG